MRGGQGGASSRRDVPARAFGICLTAPGVRRQAGRLAECLAEVGCVAEAREAGDGRELVRDYVPVRDPVTGGAALWDKVSEGYFRNSGKYQLAGGGAERAWQVGAVILIK